MKQKHWTQETTVQETAVAQIFRYPRVGVLSFVFANFLAKLVGRRRQTDAADP
jgi:hypothetical protein